MDDQNLGVASRAEGLRVLAEVGKSLARSHLTPNSKKSRILTLSEARRHFHLDLNALLDRAEAASRSSVSMTRRRKRVRRLCNQIWGRAQQHDAKGEFDKVLKRLYRLAGFSKARFLRRRALSDVLNDPSLSERVCDYVRASGSVLEYLNFIDLLLTHPEQVYDSVSVVAIESLLRLEPNSYEARRIRQRATEIIHGRLTIPGARDCMPIAPLLFMRYGDRRSLPLLEKCLNRSRKELAPQLARSLGFVVASYGPTSFSFVRRVASRWFHNPLARIVQLVESIRSYDDVPNRYRNRLSPRFDPVTVRTYLDMRGVLTARLLALNGKPAVRNWLTTWKQNLLNGASAYDRALLNRLL